MLRALRSVHDAEDATQQVMLQLLEALPRYRQGQAPFVAWALVVAHNYASDCRRRRARETVTDPVEIEGVHERGSGWVDGASARQTRNALSELIAPLSPVHRQILYLLYEHDMSPEDVGRVLGRSAASVRQEHRRAREKLRVIVSRESGRMFAG